MNTRTWIQPEAPAQSAGDYVKADGVEHACASPFRDAHLMFGSSLPAEPDTRSCSAGSDEIIRLGVAYFTRLDVLTNSTLGLAPDPISAIIRDLRDTLSQRLFLRRRMVGQPIRHAELPDHDHEAIERISGLLLGLMKTIFGDDLTAPPVTTLIGQTHDLFSWGGLRFDGNPAIRRPDNAPDGAVIFLYPEFAQLALAHGFEMGVWTALLPHLTRMPALYLMVYEADERERLNIPREFEKYVGIPRTQLTRSTLFDRATELRLNLKDLDPAELGVELGRLAFRAFTDPT